MKLREYHPEDLNEIAKLFYDTVHSINIKDYTEEQVNAWAPQNTDVARLNNKLSNNYSVVVEKNNVIVGFGNIDITGYFDLLYIHKDYQKLGIATMIADEIESHGYRSGYQIIKTDASITAKPFFEKRGYKTVRENHVELRGQTLTNFHMEKHLIV